MVYSKPELYVENFLANMSVAAITCQTDPTGENAIDYKEQPVTCIRQEETIDYIFYDSCKMKPYDLGYVNEGTYNTDTAFINAIVNGDNIPAGATAGEAYTTGDKGTGPFIVTLAGLFTVWKEGSRIHFGPANANVVSIMTSSY